MPSIRSPPGVQAEQDRREDAEWGRPAGGGFGGGGIGGGGGGGGARREAGGGRGGPWGDGGGEPAPPGPPMGGGRRNPNWESGAGASPAGGMKGGGVFGGGGGSGVGGSGDWTAARPGETEYQVRGRCSLLCTGASVPALDSSGVKPSDPSARGCAHAQPACDK
jgi:hypothetical protein